MKPNKMNLENIQGKLSRNEMKNIMAGNAPGTGPCNCNSKDECKEGEICGSDCEVGNTGKAGHCTEP